MMRGYQLTIVVFYTFVVYSCVRSSSQIESLSDLLLVSVNKRFVVRCI